MNDRNRGQPNPRRLNSAQWFTGVSIGLIVLVCLLVFAIAFIQIDPYLSDFVSDDNPPTASPTSAPTLPLETNPDSDGTPSGMYAPGFHQEGVEISSAVSNNT